MKKILICLLILPNLSLALKTGYTLLEDMVQLNEDITESNQGLEKCLDKIDFR